MDFVFKLSFNKLILPKRSVNGFKYLVAFWLVCTLTSSKLCYNLILNKHLYIWKDRVETASPLFFFSHPVSIPRGSHWIISVSMYVLKERFFLNTQHCQIFLRPFIKTDFRIPTTLFSILRVVLYQFTMSI